MGHIIGYNFGISSYVVHRAAVASFFHTATPPSAPTYRCISLYNNISFLLYIYIYNNIHIQNCKYYYHYILYRIMYISYIYIYTTMPLGMST